MARFLGFLLVFSLASSVHAGVFGPSTYEECILENMKGVQSNVAAAHIVRACRQQFPEEPKVSRLEKAYPWLASFIRDARAKGVSDADIEKFIKSDPDMLQGEKTNR